MNEPDADPVFDAPWQAKAFALVVRLHEQGHFTWEEWTRELGAAIGKDGGAGYYDNWLTALESLLSAKAIVGMRDIADRQRDWREAASRTPHGQAIELRPADRQ